VAALVAAMSAASPAAAAPAAEGPARDTSCGSECRAVDSCHAGRCVVRCDEPCESGERCSEAGRCEPIDPERSRLERRLSKGRTMLLVGGTMVGGGVLALGVGSAFTFTAESGDSDDMFGPFLMLGGTIAAVTGLLVLGIGSGVFVSNRSALRELEAERRRVRVSPSLRANARGVGAGLVLRF
jgi:hypothetical protein